MNLGNKETKRRFRYRVTGAGWIVLGIALFLAFIEYKPYIKPFLRCASTVYKMNRYDMECESLVEVDCVVKGIYYKYSSDNNYKEPIHIISCKNIGTGKDFTLTEKESPGNVGDTIKAKIKKGSLIKEDVGRPALGDKDIGIVGIIPTIGLLVMIFISALIPCVFGGKELIQDKQSGEDMTKLEMRIIFLLYLGPTLVMIILSLLVWIFSL